MAYYPIDIANVLNYHAWLGNSVRDYTKYDYTNLNGNTETDFDNIIWNDVRAKPDFLFIESNNDPAYEWQIMFLTYDHYIDDRGQIAQNTTDVGSLSSSLESMSAALAEKQDAITPAAHVPDSPTDAPTNAPTNLNVLTTLLGVLVGEVNSTNAKQNATAAKLNETATNLNNLIARLESAGILQSS